MDVQEFESILREIRVTRDTPLLRSPIDHVYHHPELYLGSYADIIYIARNLPEVFGDELNADIESIAQHCEEKLQALDEPQKQLNKLQEKIRQIPVAWAANTLSEGTIVAGLEYPYHKHFRASNFCRSLCGSSGYAIQVMAESEKALAQHGSGKDSARKAIKTILDYTKSYYAERSSVEQAVELLLHIDNFLNNSLEFPQAAIEAMHATREAVASGMGDSERREQISNLFYRFKEAKAAVQFITDRQLPEFRSMVEILIQLADNDSGEKRAYLADPSQYLFESYVDSRNIAAFKLVMHTLAEKGSLEDNPGLKAAFATVDRFADEILSPKIHLFDRTFAEEMDRKQRDIKNIHSAIAVEEHVPDIAGLQDTVVQAIKNSGTVQRRNYHHLLDSLLVLSECTTADASLSGHVDIMRGWINDHIASSTNYDAGYTIIDAEARLASGELSENGRTALVSLIETINEHYSRYNEHAQNSVPEPQRTVIFCRANIALRDLADTTGLAGINELISVLEHAQYDIPHHLDIPFEQWHLRDGRGREKAYQAGQYKAVLQKIVADQGEHARAAKNIIAYLDYYYKAAGYEWGLDTSASEFSPAWKEAVQIGVEEQFILAINGDPQAAVAIVEPDDIRAAIDFSIVPENPMSRFVLERFLEREYDDALEDLRDALGDTPPPPTTVANFIARNSRQLSGILAILPKMAENPQTVLWDTAKWLSDAEPTPYSNTQSIQPHIASVTNYIKRIFPANADSDVFGLAKEMGAAREAMVRFDINNHVLDALCTDEPKIVDMQSNEFIPRSTHAAECALLEVRLDHEIAIAGSKKEVAEKAKPFLHKAIDHAEIRGDVDVCRERISQLMHISNKLDFLNEAEINDNKKLLNNMDAGYGMAGIIAIVDDVIAATEEGAKQLTVQQMQSLRQFKQQAEEMTDAHGMRESFDKSITEARASIAFERIIEVAEELPELGSIRNKRGETVTLSSLFVIMHPYSKEAEDVPHFAEQLFIAVQDALASNRDLPAGLQRSLHALEEGLQESFEQTDKALADEGLKDTKHAKRIEAIREQRKQEGEVER